MRYQTQTQGAEPMKNPKKPKRKEAFSMREVCQILGISLTKTRQMVANGELPSIRLGTNERAPVRVTREALARILGYDPPDRVDP